MRFNPEARINTSRVRDSGRAGRGAVLGAGRSSGGRRGRTGRTPGGSGGAMNLPLPGGAGGGVRIAGVLVVVLFLVLSQCLGGTDGSTGSAGPSGTTDQGTGSERYDVCEAAGADANQNVDCARVLVENSLRQYWAETLPAQTGTAFTPTTVQTFTEAVSTGGCGEASAAVGPFYCPVDQVVYLDTTFFDTVLENQLGGSGGDFVEPYVLAHEYGHHVQNLLGTLGQVRTQRGPDSDAVRLELQADCFAGMWTRGALETTDDSGVRIFESLEPANIDEALDAARTVGDDLIQQRSGGRVDPEGWTHRSSAQRQAWFRTGYRARDLGTCDTFAATDL